MRALLLALWLWAWHGVAVAALPLTQVLACTPVPGGCELAPATLPFSWDALHPGRAGRMEFVLRFHVDKLPTGPQALYLPRIGNGYELRLNGAPIAASVDWSHANGPDAGKVPQLVPVAPALLRANNELRIALRADVARRAGLTVPVLGDYDELMPRYRADYRRRTLTAEVGATLCFVVALLALALWHSQHGRHVMRRDSIYLYAALAMGAWTAFFADLAMEDPWPAWPLWGLLMSGAFATGTATVTLLCQQIAGLETLRSRQLMIALVVTGLASAAVALWGGLWQAWVAWLALLVVGYAAYALYFAAVCIRSPGTEKLLIAAAVLANVAAGTWDWIGVVRHGDLYGNDPLGRLAPMLYALVLGYIVVQRFRHANETADHLTETMAAQVQAKSDELALYYRRMEAMGREQARTAERTRILRDMHDGVGSHISSAIRLLQSGRAATDHVVATLRESLDELKLSIDAMNLAPGDVTTLLAGLRYRLEPRFAASDIELRWDVDTIEPVERMDADATRQLQFIVYEALSNVLQHSHARTVTIAAHAAAGAVDLRVADDGGGLPESVRAGKGLNSMRARAAAIGAQFSLHGGPQGTTVSVRLPRVAGAG